jgi:hypothetical protein
MVLGSILIVTGPTVIGPVLRWEGILIDPLGAMLALLMFEAGLSSSVEGATHKVRVRQETIWRYLRRCARLAA